MVRSFSMPCLNKYVFYTDGRVKRKFTEEYKQVLHCRNKTPYYTLTLDDRSQCKVTRREIIQYGKHYYEALGNILGLNMQIVIMRPRIVTTRKSILK